MVTLFLGEKNARSAILIILQETNKSDKKEAHLSSFYLAFSTISSAVPVQSGSSFAFFSYEIL